MGGMTTSLNRNPSTVAEARRQWLAAVSVAETAERVYNAAIEKGLPETEPPVEVDPDCACRPNVAGDIRCHKCGEYVNVKCWNCKTPRGAGKCPTAARERRA